MIDTLEEVQKIYDEKIRQLSEEERFLRGLSLTHLCREMCLEGLRERHPTADAHHLRKLFSEFLYRRECQEGPK